MKKKFNDVFLAFKAVESQMHDLLVSSDNPNHDHIQALDDKISDAFDKVLHLKCTCVDGCLARVGFLVDQLCDMPCDSVLYKRIIDQIEADLISLKEFKVKQVDADALHTNKNSSKDMPYIELCYASKARCSMSDTDLEALEKQAKIYNENNQITGILIYDEKTRQFFQILEGPEHKVQYLMHKIIADKRHSEIDIRFKMRVKEREYNQWAMCLMTTAQIKSEISENTSFSSWLYTYLGLDDKNIHSHSFEWFKNSVHPLID